MGHDDCLQVAVWKKTVYRETEVSTYAARSFITMFGSGLIIFKSKRKIFNHSLKSTQVNNYTAVNHRG